MATTWNKRISAGFTIGMLFGRRRVFTEGSTFTSKTRKGSFHWPAAFMCDKSIFFLDTAIVEKVFLPYPHFLEKFSFFHTYFFVKKVFLFTPIFWHFFSFHPIWVNIISEMKVVTPTTTTRRTTLSVPWPVGFAADKNLLSPVEASKSLICPPFPSRNFRLCYDMTLMEWILRRLRRRRCFFKFVCGKKQSWCERRLEPLAGPCNFARIKKYTVFQCICQDPRGVQRHYFSDNL